MGVEEGADETLQESDSACVPAKVKFAAGLKAQITARISGREGNSMTIEQAQLETEQGRKTARQVLYWTALASTILGALYLLGLAGKLIVDGTVHSVSSPGVQSISAVVGLLWDVGLVILFTALRRQGTRSRRIYADLALMFILLACATSSVNWFVQLAIIPKLGAGGNETVSALLDVHNEQSISYAMEHLGWGLFYGLAAIFASAGMRGGKLEAWISRLLLASGVLSLVHFVGVAAGSALLGDLGYVAWALLLPAATALLVVRSGKSRAA